MTEIESREKRRHYWLKNIKSVYDKLKVTNPKCDYDLSRREVACLIIALKLLKQQFFDGSDCSDTIKALERKSGLMAKDLKFLRQLNEVKKNESN